MPALLSAPIRAEAWSCERSQGASPPEQRWATLSRPTKSLLGISGVMVSFLSGRPRLAGGGAGGLEKRLGRVGIDGAVGAEQEPASMHLGDRLPCAAGQRRSRHGGDAG